MHKLAENVVDNESMINSGKDHTRIDRLPDYSKADEFIANKHFSLVMARAQYCLIYHCFRLAVTVLYHLSFRAAAC